MEQYFSLIGARHRFRDPIYGFILLTDAEKEVIDTPLFQRLRRVHQLALTKYVYPSAEHSRFVHSLGVMHCATLILAGIFGHKHSNEISTSPKAKLIKTLRFAALLHDIGHLPFSHAVEKQWLQGLKHEDLSQHIIEKYLPITTILENEEVNPKDVSSLLAKKPRSKLRLLHEIVSGQLDADRADYLLRDAHFCGARYGEYDFPRFLQIFCASEDEEHGHLILFIDENDLHVAESLLIARYHYNLQIPYHRTRVGYDLVLGRFMRDFNEYREPFSVVDGHLNEVDFDRLVDLDDCEIMERIKKENRDNNPWAPYLLRANHLIPIIDTSSTSEKGKQTFKVFVRKLEESGIFHEGEDYFVKSDGIEIIKGNIQFSEKPTELSDAVHPNPEIIMLRSCEGKGRKAEYVDIRDRSWIFGQFAAVPPTLHRVYVIPEKEKLAGKMLADIGHLGKGETP